MIGLEVFKRRPLPVEGHHPQIEIERVENVQKIAECDIGDPVALKRGNTRAADTRQLGKPLLRQALGASCLTDGLSNRAEGSLSHIIYRMG